jgi:hypothetical protein
LLEFVERGNYELFKKALLREMRKITIRSRK